jgi:Sensors of blue-light using FAD
MGVTQLIYTSTAVRDMSTADLEALMTTAIARNAELGITGILVYFSQTLQFIQLLEGARSSVLELYHDHIVKDGRHRDCDVYYEDCAEDRLCPDWSMSYQIEKEGAAEDRLKVSDFIDGGSLGNDEMAMPLLVMTGYRDMCSRSRRV